ncbi:hypothetical protein [Arthrobacter sp. UYCo732]
MTDILVIYILIDRLSPVLVLVILAGVFAAVRHSERIKPLKSRRDG